VSDEEFVAGLEQHIANEVREGWELIREAAEATLAENPHDETAKDQMLGYQQFKRKPTFVIGGKPKEPTERFGVWKQGSDGNYYIYVARCEVGDTMRVKRSNGKSQQYKLTEKVAHNLFKGRGV
jgi:hypothetical protein